MKKIFTAILLLFACSVVGQMYVSPTRYNYTNVAKSITTSCNTKMEKVRAIYDWICGNIRYDTSYRIYTADECYDQRKGVCQAYSELFYRLCEAVDVKCIIISGISKDIYGTVKRSGHAWIYAEVEGGSILIDPTWGAGSVNGNRFEFKEDHDYWFMVNPYWMIFTHFPEDNRFQFLKQPINEQTFAKLPPLDPSCKYFGWDARDIFQRCMSGEIQTMPQLFPKRGINLSLIDIPMQQTLNPATTYHFEVEANSSIRFAIIANNNEWIWNNLWKQSGNRYSIDLMPGGGKELHIAIEQPDGSGYKTLVLYKVQPPTATEQQYISTHQRPTIYAHTLTDGTKLIEIPPYKRLSPAQVYHFELECSQSESVAIIVNDKWYMSDMWTQSGNRYTIDVMPQEGGVLMVAIKNQKGSYNTIAEYTVSEPTTNEMQIIQQHILNELKQPIN